MWVWIKYTYICSDEYCNVRVYQNCFKEFDQNVITFINTYSVTNNIEKECGSDSNENDDRDSSSDRLNDNFNDDDPKIDFNDFYVTSQDHYVTFDDLDVLSRDNDDTDAFIIPIDLIPKKLRRYISQNTRKGQI